MKQKSAVENSQGLKTSPAMWSGKIITARNGEGDQYDTC